MRLSEGCNEFTTDTIKAQREQVNKLIREGDMVPLVTEQDEKLEVALAEAEWQANSKLIYLLHDPTPQLIKRLSGARKPSRQLTKPVVEANADQTNEKPDPSKPDPSKSDPSKSAQSKPLQT